MASLFSARIRRLLLAAAAVAAAHAWMAPESSAGTCPKQTFLSFGGYAYVAQALPASTGIEAGATLGNGTLDEPTSADGCKRRRESVSVRKAGGIESRVAVMVFGLQPIFVLGSRCDGFEGDEHWRCLLQPVVFEGRRYTGVRYPRSPGPRRTVAHGRPLGRAEAGGSAVTVVRIPRVPASVAVAVAGRPNDAYVAPGVCPYESFENASPRDDLRRCLESPVWFVFDPPGAAAGDLIVGVADRPLPPQLADATVSLVRLPAATDAVPKNRAGSVSVGRVRPKLRLTVPDLPASLYEAVVSCSRCAASYGGKTVFPAGSFLVGEPTKGSSGVRAVSIALAAGVLVLAAASVVFWRRGRRRRALRDGSGGA
ncbi:MAG: hypothetical protein ACR2L0_06510 [Gaiellaceae bacterium]